ncbi:hypothetical protein [Streptomyces sp. NPDC001435]|uniref:hypothetical protein n=1 Tax=Streptomyces sp. NPDC001435 TaxID=3364576 RepID=UPI00369FCA33
MSASSKPRPRDWHPLADSDPVPGDPEEIRDEVKHMVQVAENLRAQAKLLRGIKDDNELKGKYATKLREESEVLEKHLREVAGRYERVNGHLTNWADELEDFQSDADKVLANAKREQEELEADKAKKESGEGNSGKAPDDDPLQKYRTQLDRITGDRDDRAAHYAGEIGDQLNDVIEDSWWDDFKGWIHDNIDTIKFVLDALGWAATILGFIALFIPGLNLLVIGISIFIAASRFLMYAAGEASLTEVLVDCVGLVTMALGVGMLSKLKIANNAVKTASKAQRLDRLKAAVRANKSARESIQRVIAESSDDGLRQFGRQTLNRMRREILDNAGRVSDEAAEMPLSRLERLGLGDSDARALVENIRKNTGTFPNAASALGRSEAYYRTAVGAAAFGTAADFTDKALGESPVFPDKPFYTPYEDGKGELWKLPQDTHW